MELLKVHSGLQREIDEGNISQFATGHKTPEQFQTEVINRLEQFCAAWAHIIDKTLLLRYDSTLHFVVSSDEVDDEFSDRLSNLDVAIARDEWNVLTTEMFGGLPVTLEEYADCMHQEDGAMQGPSLYEPPKTVDEEDELYGIQDKLTRGR